MMMVTCDPNVDHSNCDRFLFLLLTYVGPRSVHQTPTISVHQLLADLSFKFCSCFFFFLLLLCLRLLLPLIFTPLLLSHILFFVPSFSLSLSLSLSISLSLSLSLSLCLSPFTFLFLIFSFFLSHRLILSFSRLHSFPSLSLSLYLASWLSLSHPLMLFAFSVDLNPNSKSNHKKPTEPQGNVHQINM